MVATAQFLEELSRKRLKWIDANRENNFEQGILNLLTELYPEQAHFIFELFQNAEDAIATSITFKLSADKLIVMHNGTRQFNAKDVESITSIGQSTKKDDLNQIGKFGVGFKAVFSYTTTPIVHSDDFNFEIRDLVCPYPIEKPTFKKKHTQFVFPFNNNNKSPDKCFEEVAKGLNSLQDNVLLFLNNINEISWEIDGRGKGRLARYARENNVVEIKNEGPKAKSATSSYWLRFLKKVAEKDGLFVGVAYRLEYLDELNIDFDEKSKISKTMAIVPIEGDGQLSIYFPAEKEVTKLKFHIHGPYASTVARDSLKYDHEGNLALLRLTAELVAESLNHIKSHGLLTTDFLAVMPNNKDDLNTFYRPIQVAIICEFANKKLLPGQYLKFISSRTAKDGPADIKSIINDTDLAVLYGNSEMKWVKAAKQKNSRADNFIESLNIREWGWDQLAETIKNKFGNKADPIANAWLNKKSDEWMQKFYYLLDHLVVEKKYDHRVIPTTWKIIRTADNSHRTGNEVFFPNTGPLNVENDKFIRLKANILTLQGKSKRQLERAEHFLQEAGVSAVGEAQEIEVILDEFYAPRSKDPSERLHMEHMERFINHWRKTGETTMFQRHYIFKDVAGKLFCMPFEVFLDKPYMNTSLSGFYSALAKHNINAADEIFEVWHNYNILSYFTAFAQAVGVITKIKIIKTTIGSNHPDYVRLITGFNGAGWSCDYGIDEDYTVSYLEDILKLNDVNVSKAMWLTMCLADTKVLKARYRPNSRCYTHTSYSSLVDKLKKSQWIPSVDGKFYKPEDMSNEMLMSGFSYDSDEWLNSIDFGKSARVQSEEYKQKLELVEKLGISLPLAEYLRTLTNDEQNIFLSEFITWRNQKNMPSDEELPRNPAPDPTRRYSKAEEEAEVAEEKEYEKKERSVRTNRNPDIKAYLKEHNTNDNGNVICQICCKKMPFKIGGLEDYFESVQCIKSVKKDLKSNHVALCPNCAAEYKYACNTSEADRIDYILTLDHISDVELSVPLEMPVHDKIRFTQKHFIELKAVLQHLEENRDSNNAEDTGNNEYSLAENDDESTQLINASQATTNNKAGLYQKPFVNTHNKNTNTESAAKHLKKQKIEPIIIYNKRSESALIQATANINTQNNVIHSASTSLADKRVERAIASMNKLSCHDNQKVLIKGKETVLKFINHDEYKSDLKSEGIPLSSLKMAMDHLVQSFDYKKLGFKKFIEFVKHVCASTNATVYVMPNNEAVLGLKNQKLSGAKPHVN